MFELDIETDRVSLKGLDSLTGDARFACAIALTKTAKLAKADVKDAMTRVFDRPTPFTLNSVYAKPARKNDLVAGVFFRDTATKGTPASKYIFPEVYGGGRRLKRSERSLQAAGKMPAGMFSTPGPGAELDRYGNVNRGQIVKLLSYLKASHDPAQNRNPEGRQRGKRKNEHYFAILKATGPLTPGVFKRVGDKGRGFVKVLNYTDSPSYSKRLPFAEIVGATVDREFLDQFDMAFASVVSHAKYGKR